jgi:hypothetical protein
MKQILTFVDAFLSMLTLGFAAFWVRLLALLALIVWIWGNVALGFGWNSALTFPVFVLSVWALICLATAAFHANTS